MKKYIVTHADGLLFIRFVDFAFEILYTRTFLQRKMSKLGF
jgi:hypothetical protein